MGFLRSPREHTEKDKVISSGFMLFYGPFMQTQPVRQ